MKYLHRCVKTSRKSTCTNQLLKVTIFREVVSTCLQLNLRASPNMNSRIQLLAGSSHLSPLTVLLFAFQEKVSQKCNL